MLQESGLVLVTPNSLSNVSRVQSLIQFHIMRCRSLQLKIGI